MLTPARMKRVCITVLRADATRVTRAVGELGVVHLTSATGEEARRLAPGPVDRNVERCEELLGRAQKLMDGLGISLAGGIPGPRAFEMTLEDARRAVERLEEAASPLLDRRRELDEQLERRRAARAALHPFRRVDVPFERLTGRRFVRVLFGSMREDRIDEARRQLPSAAMMVPLDAAGQHPDGTVERNVLVMASRKGRFGAKTVLEGYGFEERELPDYPRGVPSELYRREAEKCEELARERKEVSRRLEQAAREHGRRLTDACRRLLLESEVYRAEKNFGVTWATVVMTGWVPADQVERLRRAVRQVTGGRAIVEERDANRREIAEAEVPSQPVHLRLLRPFERLVSGYGSASYDEVEPTLLFAASFLLMFGLMFGDLGHGLCVLAVGLVLYRRAGSGSALKDLGYVIAAAGLTGAVFGAFVQGVFFGKSLADMGFRWTLAFEPVRLEGAGAGAGEHVLRYLALSLALGVALISLGVILNVVNRLRGGDYFGAVFHRFGLVGGLFYWAAVGLAAGAVFVGRLPEAWLWGGVTLTALPLLVLLFRGPIHGLMSDRAGQMDGGSVIMEGVMEVMEAAMMYVANTLSFLRVAALALSHAALSYTVFVLVRLLWGLPGGVVWAGLAFVLGTGVIVVLEGMIVGIQIFRLEYYEFFSKFFRAQGRRYRPFRLTGASPSA